ncbi:MAG: AraC family transcriptional regulator [Firmicutes bacterium]|nr:AraC family transcriptional regulator [Bacillota bacterium]
MNTIDFVGEHAQTFDVRWHCHDVWEMVYCTGGEGRFYFENGTVLPYQEGEAVAVPPGELHSNVSEEGFTNIHLQMDDPTFPYKTAFRVTDDADRHLREAFRQAKYYYLSDIRRSDLVLSALGELIVSYMVVFRSNSDYSEPVEQIRSQILRRYAEPGFALDEAIRALPFHYDYLRKLFKKEVGATPLEYLTQMRMKKAGALLTARGARDYTVSEVALLCGFDDALYFSRVFKKFYGVSPSAYASAGKKGKGDPNLK